MKKLLKMDYRAILSSPHFYIMFQYLMGARKVWREFVDESVRPQDGMSILDLGCGPGEILKFLPNVRYCGFDISEKYIRFARRRYTDRGNFYCKYLGADDLTRLEPFDLVIMSGVLHHLSDEEAVRLIKLARSLLKGDGRFVSIDPCFIPNQNLLARFLIMRDRGHYVRSPLEYLSLLSPHFENRVSAVKQRVWIPYTHCVIEADNLLDDMV